MRTRAVFFPFDLFGGGGTRAGAELLADAVREMLADNRREKVPTRARAYTSKLTVEEVPFATLADYQGWREQARAKAAEALRKGEFLLWVTGNHLGALPVYEELGRQDNSLVVQFDAHLDVYNLLDCTAELSHGNFLLHASGPLPALVNVGHRELLLRPDYVGRFYRRTFAAAELAADPEPALAFVREACGQADRVLLDLDCDALDPAFFPALAHPQPFGLSPHLLLRFLDAAWSERVAGLCISEFDPARDVNDRSLATLLWLTEYVLLKKYEKK